MAGCHHLLAPVTISMSGCRIASISVGPPFEDSLFRAIPAKPNRPVGLAPVAACLGPELDHGGGALGYDCSRRRGARFQRASPKTLSTRVTQTER
jgi:hypothetical protein